MDLCPETAQLLVLTLSATDCPPHQLLVLTQSVSSKLELESTLFHPVFAQYAPQIAELATAEWGQVMALTLPLSATDCPPHQAEWGQVMALTLPLSATECPPHQLFLKEVSHALRALLLIARRRGSQLGAFEKFLPLWRAMSRMNMRFGPLWKDAQVIASSNCLDGL